MAFNDEMMNSAASAGGQAARAAGGRGARMPLPIISQIRGRSVEEGAIQRGKLPLAFLSSERRRDHRQSSSDTDFDSTSELGNTRTTEVSCSFTPNSRYVSG